MLHVKPYQAQRREEIRQKLEAAFPEKIENLRMVIAQNKDGNFLYDNQILQSILTDAWALSSEQHSELFMTLRQFPGLLLLVEIEVARRTADYQRDAESLARLREDCLNILNNPSNSDKLRCGVMRQLYYIHKSTHEYHHAWVVSLHNNDVSVQEIRESTEKHSQLLARGYTSDLFVYEQLSTDEASSTTVTAEALYRRALMYGDVATFPFLPMDGNQRKEARNTCLDKACTLGHKQAVLDRAAIYINEEKDMINAATLLRTHACMPDLNDEKFHGLCHRKSLSSSDKEPYTKMDYYIDMLKIETNRNPKNIIQNTVNMLINNTVARQWYAEDDLVPTSIKKDVLAQLEVPLHKSLSSSFSTGIAHMLCEFGKLFAEEKENRPQRANDSSGNTPLIRINI